ncbi:MAG: hypothetical protein COA94_01445 [Rickettsiales bacterium]|nr:MAG: hypothetical protein COA94_01445 [Rickettsiales bacterium]
MSRKRSATTAFGNSLQPNKKLVQVSNQAFLATPDFPTFLDFSVLSGSPGLPGCMSFPGYAGFPGFPDCPVPPGLTAPPASHSDGNSVSQAAEHSAKPDLGPPALPSISKKHNSSELNHAISSYLKSAVEISNELETALRQRLNGTDRDSNACKKPLIYLLSEGANKWDQNKGLVIKLLAEGDKIDELNNRGIISSGVINSEITALMHTCGAGSSRINLEAFKFLLSQDADITACNYRGWNVVDYIIRGRFVILAFEALLDHCREHKKFPVSLDLIESCLNNFSIREKNKSKCIKVLKKYLTKNKADLSQNDFERALEMVKSPSFEHAEPEVDEVAELSEASGAPPDSFCLTPVSPEDSKSSFCLTPVSPEAQLESLFTPHVPPCFNQVIAPPALISAGMLGLSDPLSIFEFLQ